MFYHESIPDFILPFLDTPEMQRLKDIGMNCGCEYTSFPRFRMLPEYSRYSHSLGAALIVWHFTSDKIQTLSALFHDIASPVFAHTIDFLKGDYLSQESTESGTAEIIAGSSEISALLESEGITADRVSDYHMYPIADNDSPRLSADRLEYSLGNMVSYGFCDAETAAVYYDDITVSGNGKDAELAFRSPETALSFARNALKCSKVYVSDEDRYSMQILSEIIGFALAEGVIAPSDLYTTEKEVISKLVSLPSARRMWDEFRLLSCVSRVSDGTEPGPSGRLILAKKRCIDPLVAEKGRLSSLDHEFGNALDEFREESQSYFVCAV